MMIQPTTQTSLQSYIKPAALATGAVAAAKLVAEAVGPFGIFSDMQYLPCVSCDHILSMMPNIVSSHPILASTVAVGAMISSATYCYKDEIKYFILKRQIVKGLETQIADPAERAKLADQTIEIIKCMKEMAAKPQPAQISTGSSSEEASKPENNVEDEKENKVEEKQEEKKPGSTKMNLRPRRQDINYRELGGVRARA